MARLPRVGGSGSARPDRVPVLAVLAGLGIVALVLALFWVERRLQPQPTDAVTLCQVNVAPPVVTTIVIDTTDALTRTERAQILQEVERIRDRTPTTSLLEVYRISDRSSDTVAPLLALCNPGDGEDLNELYQNPVLARERWNTEFRERLETALLEILDAPSVPQSPLMESLRALSAEQINRPEFDTSEKRLVVFSDLLQHTSQYSQYTTPNQTFDAFKATGRFEGFQADLRGVSVSIFYITRARTRRLQNMEHVEFWTGYFDACGASVEYVKKILGD